ncbi:bifunctional dihydroflavonol 4-reductase/flavanone 4-reductase-like [Pyrus ussuriensis x Pyrus communis]|uniref:Bifunctional dihydroflavonol 4-reductase/flavanone 4-reductase-like n=1 Tax=Pyrus ussuriensis x Pyrus communis TaxID=2448454 RepID=A0A5N5H1W9_9ROSA|nr:bifunctional dihydroflavonol 4-reductase/flavanone 4-reductase-like [Pyrus ussuriensis x Pyrus communis]
MGGGGSSGRDCLGASCGWKMNLVGLGDEFDGAVLPVKMNLEVWCGLCCGVESSEKKQRKRIRVVRERQSCQESAWSSGKVLGGERFFNVIVTRDGISRVVI